MVFLAENASKGSLRSGFASLAPFVSSLRSGLINNFSPDKLEHLFLDQLMPMVYFSSNKTNFWFIFQTLSNCSGLIFKHEKINRLSLKDLERRSKKKAAFVKRREAGWKNLLCAATGQAI